jgi:hypothetical protein
MTNRLAGALIAGALAVGLLLGAAATILGRDTATPAREDRSASMMGGGSMGGMMGGGGMSPELHQSHHAQPTSNPTP